MAPILSLPVDICLSIFRYLSVQDVLSVRQTCKSLLEITQLRSVWHLLLTTQILQKNIPVPGCSRPIESLTAFEIEKLTLRALRLRDIWTSLSPVPKSQFTITCDVLPTRHGVVALQFLPGRRHRYLLSLALASNVGRLFSLQCWDMEATPPTCIAMRTVRQCGWFVVNSEDSNPAILAVQSPEIEILTIDFSGVNPISGFSTMARITGRIDKLQGLHGSIILTRDDQNHLYLWNKDSPGPQLELRSSSSQLETPLEVIVQDRFAIVIRRSTLEIFSTHPPTSGSKTTVAISPIAEHAWPWKLDSVSIALQAPWVDTQLKGHAPINVLTRYGSLLPWPVNLLHYYVLHPNNSYDASKPVDTSNVPYDITPILRRTISSPIRLFAIYHMTVGSRGMALWIDSHTEDYFARGDRGQRIAGNLTVATNTEVHDPIGAPENHVESTMEASVFSFCEDDSWTRVAVDEEEGKIAIGCVDGTISIMEYA